MRSQKNNVETLFKNSSDNRSPESPINGWNNIVNSQLISSMDSFKISPTRSYGKIHSTNVSPSDAIPEEIMEKCKVLKIKKLGQNHRRTNNLPQM